MDTDNEPPKTPTHFDQESKLIDEIQSAVSGQKATFCCGGSVPIIIADSDEAKEHRFDDVAGLIASPRVVLRWDLSGGMYGAISKSSVFRVTLAFYCIVSSRRGVLQSMRVGIQRSLVFKSRADEGYDHRQGYW